jgi:predicted nucleotidyltransferase
VFGSVVRKDFRPDSDIHVLVSFEAGAGTSLVDLVTVQDELAAVLGRPVDLIEIHDGSLNVARPRDVLQGVRD